jgi:hypothetical protein
MQRDWQSMPTIPGSITVFAGEPRDFRQAGQRVALEDVHREELQTGMIKLS